MSTIKEVTKVMKEFYKNNKTVQFRDNDSENAEWVDTNTPSFNWELYDYRIKPESIKRPMTFEEIYEYWKKHRTEIFNIYEGSYSGMMHYVNFSMKTFYIGEYIFNAESFVKKVTKEDGSKFEVEIDEENYENNRGND